ncbi:MAG: LysE family translocator [Brachymonas denitrificans]|uniref:LysE family translocator n=1 Tax=Brachymonas denitrificans TaxID=28220 RepID=UPI002020F6B4|nr:LysE family translocator [Brachymonas denitrificans]
MLLSPDVAIGFFGIAVLLALSPGPDNLFVITLSALRGVRAGLWVVLGLCSGLIVHTLAVAWGVAALFAASATAFTVLKLLGAAYLLYLAWGAWNAPASVVDDSGGPSVPDMTPMQAWLRGVIMNLTNPKVILFFLAFLPQFSNPARGSVAVQTFLLGLIFILAAGLTFSTLALLAGSIGRKLQRSASAQTWLNRSASVVFAGLALKLLVSQR